jgi:transposase-like protein
MKCMERETVMDWMMSTGLLPRSKICEGCQQPMKFAAGKTTQQMGRFRCRRRKCPQRDVEVSIAKHSIFYGTNLPIETILHVLYSYSVNDTYDSCRREAIVVDADGPLKDERLGQKTIAEWYCHCREAIIELYVEEEEARGKIGGFGVVVQIDESKFGKRKYNKGRRTEGHWVLGIIADGSDDLRLILCPNNKRTANELLPIIQQHVLPGTTIRTDLWRAYADLGNLGFIHKVVNHSDKVNPFVATDGTHTNRIEASWRPAKTFFRGVHLKSVCDDCTSKLNEVGNEARMRAREVNHLQEECTRCGGVEEPCMDHKKELKAIKSDVRKKVRMLYNARSECDLCQKLAEDFADKMIEYLWRRKVKKEGLNAFMEVVRALAKE